jgi:hypothetical protein
MPVSTSQEEIEPLSLEEAETLCTLIMGSRGTGLRSRDLIRLNHLGLRPSRDGAFQWGGTGRTLPAFARSPSNYARESYGFVQPFDVVVH